MQKSIAKKVALRESFYEYFHVKQCKDGTIILEPRVLIDPNDISENSLKMMDKSVENYKKGKASKAIDLSEYGD